MEYPKLLDFSYIENFLGSIQERLELIYANFYPLTHISLQDSTETSRLTNHAQNISTSLSKIPALVIEIQTREELAMPLLKTIEGSMRVTFN